MSLETQGEKSFPLTESFVRDDLDSFDKWFQIYQPDLDSLKDSVCSVIEVRGFGAMTSSAVLHLYDASFTKPNSREQMVQVHNVAETVLLMGYEMGSVSVALDSARSVTSALIRRGAIKGMDRLACILGVGVCRTYRSILRAGVGLTQPSDDNLVFLDDYRNRRIQNP